MKTVEETGITGSNSNENDGNNNLTPPSMSLKWILILIIGLLFILASYYWSWNSLFDIPMTRLQLMFLLSLIFIFVYIVRFTKTRESRSLDLIFSRQNKPELDRFQTLLWGVTLVSTLFVYVTHWITHDLRPEGDNPDRLVDPQWWWLLALVVGNQVVIEWLKKRKGAGEEAHPSSKKSVRDVKGKSIPVVQYGRLWGFKDKKDATFSDIVKKDDFDSLEDSSLAKTFGLILTVVLVISYIFMVGSDLQQNEQKILQIPWFSSDLIIALAISLGGYAAELLPTRP